MIKSDSEFKIAKLKIMKIGYPCINSSLDCKSGRTFRLQSYSEENMIAIIKNNLDCLLKILEFNLENNILFFRITSDLVPFASHPVCTFDWQNYFKDTFITIGNFVIKNKLRISMHPDQFTLINSIKDEIFERSVSELDYHTQVLDLMRLDHSAKIQIHVGGVYGNKEESIERFIKRFHTLDTQIKKRLVIENDDRHYTLTDCMKIHEETDIPVLFDGFHHELNNSGQNLKQAFNMFTKTWKEEDSIPMVDYSSQAYGERKGKHTGTIDEEKFKEFIIATKGFDFDIMLEIKDKEKSAIKALEIIKEVL